ncbi:putative glycolipid-binding domain-containing protein [Defluviimonas sp. SAOS-178_SWC]|uniref:putative glycolipid-binding domain-containing protein n=1 Tax=Defluviimonas sp. SAOS-178_SWC TaxID=3121287 RepID=UPI003221FAC0
MIAGSHVVMWLAHQPSGNDACRFALNSRGLVIEGSSRTGDMTRRYRVRAEPSGITRRARITSRVENRLIERDPAGRWVMNGREVPEVAGAVDIDLGFTPATNALPIRRLGLAVGGSADIVVAWLDPADRKLKPLRQIYTRLDADRYRYSSPDHGFETDLTVDRFGAVTHYPGYWDAAG